LLDTGQFGFAARHNTILKRMGLTDHVTLNFNNNMSKAAVFVDIKKAFDTRCTLAFIQAVSIQIFS
jgi:hypothetical protein